MEYGWDSPSLPVVREADLIEYFENGERLVEPDLIESVLPSGLNVLFGAPGVGKTFLAMDMAFAIAHGRPWQGRFEVRQAPVLYVLAEGSAAVRYAAIRQRYGLRASDAGPLEFVTAPAYLKYAAHVERIDSILAQRSYTGAPGFGLVVIDTLASCMTGLNENEQRDMGMALAAINSWRVGRELSGLIVHHSGHENSARERGSSVLRGAADSILALERRRGKLILSPSKPRRDGRPMTPLELRLQPVSIVQPAPVRRDGEGGEESREQPTRQPEPVGSCVIEVVGEAQASLSSDDTAMAALERLGTSSYIKWQTEAVLPPTTFGRVVHRLLDRGLVVRKDAEYSIATS